MKRTHKFREMRDIEAVVAKASSLSAAAKALGVDRSTLHRWLGAGKVKRPRSKPPLPKGEREPVPSVEPKSWAESIRAAYALQDTDLELLELAAAALAMAKDAKALSRDRLAAMARFQQLVRQLNLDVQPSARQPIAPTSRAPHVRRAPSGGDPRSVLMAVK